VTQQTTGQTPATHAFDLATHRRNTLKCIKGVVYFADDIVARWVQERLGGNAVLVPYVAIGIVHPDIKDEQVDDVNLPNMLTAGAFFWNHQPGNDIVVSVASDTFLSGRPQPIQDVLDYPFGVLDLKRLSAEIEETNTISIRNAEKLGFVLEGVKKFAGSGGCDVMLFGLYRDGCKFWKRAADPAN
jgi:hypothetical protein